MTPQPPTARQLNYLRALAHRSGQTFAWPNTSRQASREIQRLKLTQSSTRQEHAIEGVDLASEQAAREANCDVPITTNEVTGYGSTATWSHRS
jgi:hypothetical protein